MTDTAKIYFDCQSVVGNNGLAAALLTTRHDSSQQQRVLFDLLRSVFTFEEGAGYLITIEKAFPHPARRTTREDPKPRPDDDKPKPGEPQPTK
jgi:hypothetical protein